MNTSHSSHATVPDGWGGGQACRECDIRKCAEGKTIIRKQGGKPRSSRDATQHGHLQVLMTSQPIAG